MLYFIIFFFIFILGFFDLENFDKKTRNFMFYIILTIFIVLGGLRWKTGTDWDLYYYYFVTYNTFEEFNNGQFEVLYTALNYGIKLFSSEYTYFLIIYTGVTVLLKGYVIKNLENYIIISTLAYFCLVLGDIFSVRQSLAISLTLFSVVFLNQKKNFKFFFILLMAVLIHNSAIIFMLAYPFYHKKISTKAIIIIIFISLVIGASGILEPLFKQFQLFVLSFGGKDSIRISDKLDAYTNSEFSSQFEKKYAYLLSALRRIAILPVILFFRDKIKNQNYNSYINMFLLGNVLFFLFSNVSIVFVRFTAYFTVFEIFLIAAALDGLADKRMKFVLYIFFSIYLFSRLYAALNSYWDLFVPYYWIFDNNIPRIPY